MAKIDIVGKVLSEWAFKVASSVLPQVHIPVGGTLAGFMQILGVNPATYNIWSELGFLAEPVIHNLVAPAVGRMFTGVSDEQVEELALQYVDAFIAQAEKQGSVNLFGVALDTNDLTDLRSMLEERLKG